MAIQTAPEVNNDAILDRIPNEKIAHYLRNMDYVILSPTDNAIDSNDLESKLEDEGFVLVKTDDWVVPDDRDKIEIRLTGSIVDDDIKQGIQDAFDKHGHKLAQLLTTL